MRSRWLALAITTLTATANAQPGATLERYRPGATPEDDFHLGRASDFGHLRFGAQLSGSYALNPLVYEARRSDSSSEAFAVVEHQLTTTLGLSLGLFDRLVLYGGMAFVPLMSGTNDPILGAYGVSPADGGGLGDAYLGARVRLYGEARDAFAIALQAAVTLPTASVPNHASYRGDPTATFLPAVLAEIRPGYGLRIVLNVGARVRESSVSTAGNLGFDHELTYGFGLALPIYTDRDDRTHLDLHAQLYGDSAFSRFGQREGTALEALGGLRLFHSSGLVAGLAAGPGLARGFGSPDVRAILSIGWEMPRETAPVDRDTDGVLDSVDRCPDASEDIDSFEDGDGCPDPDNDRDGVLDDADACPLQPETRNGFQDDDGCPDSVPDTDGDGILDDADRCVDQPEDRDAFQDDDGCPDPDNDEDGVLDGVDRCPLQAGPRENRGCPDGDRDSDTVVDRLDNCPDEAGTVDYHGCQAPQQVHITNERLDILEVVQFRSNQATILPVSFGLLTNVANVINSHPEIEHVLVAGHTDSRGAREHNIDLSQRRSEAVVRFLVDRGHVAAERLSARGFGPDEPRIPNARTAADHAQNRRVEFRILSGTEN